MREEPQIRGKNPLPRIRRLDGFNEGWIEFSNHGRSAVKGAMTLDSVIPEPVEASRGKAAASLDHELPHELPNSGAARSSGGRVCPAAATPAKGHHYGSNHHTGRCEFATNDRFGGPPSGA